MLNSRQFPINTRLGNSSLVLLGRASRRWDPNHFTQLIYRNLQKFRDLLYEFIDDFHLDVEPEVLRRWTNQGSARSAHTDFWAHSESRQNNDVLCWNSFWWICDSVIRSQVYLWPNSIKDVGEERNRWLVISVLLKQLVEPSLWCGSWSNHPLQQLNDNMGNSITCCCAANMVSISRIPQFWKADWYFRYRVEMLQNKTSLFVISNLLRGAFSSL